MEVVLARLKYLVSHNQFQLVNRRAAHAHAVTSSLAKAIVMQLTIDDFRKSEEDRDRPGEFIWVYKTNYAGTYYLKFKFINCNSLVKFISFHESI